MKILSILLFALTNSAFASSNGYDLKVDLSLNGEHVSSPRIIVKAGEPATISQKEDNADGQFIEVIATEGSHQSILMQFTIGTIGKNGERTIIAKPQILAKENELTKITQGDTDSGKEALSLSVTAQRKIF